jgi:hypothetical protein
LLTGADPQNRQQVGDDTLVMLRERHHLIEPGEVGWLAGLVNTVVG